MGLLSDLISYSRMKINKSIINTSTNVLIKLCFKDAWLIGCVYVIQSYCVYTVQDANWLTDFVFVWLVRLVELILKIWLIDSQLVLHVPYDALPGVFYLETETRYGQFTILHRTQVILNLSLHFTIGLR